MEDERRETSWSESVEDLVESGDIDGAISVLESIVSRFGCSDAALPPKNCDEAALREAVAAMGDLANLLDSRGPSMRAEDLRKQALIFRERNSGSNLSASSSFTPPLPANPLRESKVINETCQERERSCVSAGVPEDIGDGDDVDDWETVADQPLPDIVGVSITQAAEEARPEPTTKRRGRGHFLYKKDGLYSDQLNESGIAGLSDSEEESGRGETTRLSSSRNTSTRHVLVLQDFPQSTRTTDLERVFEAFREDGLAIRWVHDTCALAVFRTPLMASRALSTASCSFKVRMMEDNSDSILSQISAKDLEPPQPRPKTSARAAQRMIAQGMGLKINSSFGARELRLQEAARKNRIQARQGLRDDAWGPDDP